MSTGELLLEVRDSCQLRSERDGPVVQVGALSITHAGRSNRMSENPVRGKSGFVDGLMGLFTDESEQITGLIRFKGSESAGPLRQGHVGLFAAAEFR